MFAGHVITDQGTKPDLDTVAPIKDYPEPDNLTDLQSFMGLANQFREYSPDLRHATHGAPQAVVQEEERLYISLV